MINMATVQPFYVAFTVTLFDNICWILYTKTMKRIYETDKLPNIFLTPKKVGKVDTHIWKSFYFTPTTNFLNISVNTLHEKFDNRV